MKTTTKHTFNARFAGTCAVTGAHYDIGEEIVRVVGGYAIASKAGAQAAEHQAQAARAMFAAKEAVAFFALYDSGRRAEASRAYDAISPTARKMVDDEAQARSERACRV